MAKITGALLSLGGSGTIAKTITYGKWKGQPYARTRVIPANPQSTEQTITRNLFSDASNIWKNAGPLLTAPWNLAATGQVKTGRNLFMGEFTADLRGDGSMADFVFSAGAKGGVAPVSSTPVGGALQIVTTIVPPTPPTGWTVTSCVAACIQDGVPGSLTSFATVEGEDLTTPYVITLTGLAAATPYAVGGWVKYAKPDGSVAYGPSLTSVVSTS